MSLLRSDRHVKEAASQWRRLVFLLAVLFAFANMAHTGLAYSSSAQAADVSIVSSLQNDVAMSMDRGTATPAKHLPGQHQDAKYGSCSFCGVVPAGDGPLPVIFCAEQRDGPLSLTARGLPPPLPPPRLHA